MSASVVSSPSMSASSQSRHRVESPTTTATTTTRSPSPLSMTTNTTTTRSRGANQTAMAHNGSVKCPELLLRGHELQQRMGSPLDRLDKKGKRFESPWNAYRVGIYAGVLFYYDNLNDLPRGVVFLVGCSVKAVDRIFKSYDQPQHAAPVTSNAEISAAEDCGPCFKITSAANRVLLFRCDSDTTRNTWIRRIKDASRSDIASRRGGPTTPTSESTALVATMDVSPTKDKTLAVRRGSRHSLDETYTRRSHRQLTNGDETVEVEPEISQMLRDAMALVRKQKEEIRDLRAALQQARDEAAALTELSIIGPMQDLAVTHAEADQLSVSSADESDDEQSRSSIPDSSSSLALIPTTRIPSPPTSDVTTNSEYLQRQARELAEIARNMQLTFQNDVPLSNKQQINSAGSSAPTEMLDRVSSTGSAYSTSGMSDAADDDYDDERLSEFDETDAKFLESSGLLDSIHKVMKDFIAPSQASTTPEEIVINDDIIAEIRKDIASQEGRQAANISLVDTTTLRSLRSQSSCDDISDYRLALPQKASRTLSAHELLSDSPSPEKKKGRRSLPSTKDLGTLVVEDNMAVVSSILNTAARDEKTALLLPLLRLFGSHNRLSRLIRWAIESEVASVMNVATLFRSDDYASRLVSTYSKTVGSGFIRLILTDPIHEIYKLRLSDVELDPEKMASEGSDALQRNADNLMSACQMVLDSILSNESKIPPSYFHICSHLNAKVISRFDGSMEGLAVEDPGSLTRSVIGGFLFLRFVCPAITTPHLHDLIDKQPTPEIRRILVLITKLLFKTATSVLFGDREPQFRILNPFIERNSGAIHQLFVNLSIAPPTDMDECFAADSLNIFSDVSPEQHERDLEVIRGVAEKNFDEIEKKLSVSGCSPRTTENLRSALLSKSEGDGFRSQRAVKTKKSNMGFLASLGKIVRKQQTET